MPRIRMCDADREEYGGPEWVEIEVADLVNESSGLVEQIEEQWDLTPTEFIRRFRRGSIKALRAAIWAGRWKVGLRDNPRTFRPLTQLESGVRYEPTVAEAKLAAELADARAALAEKLAEGGDADPPASSADSIAPSAS